MPEQIEIKGEGIVLDLLLHRKYGVRGRELVEATLLLNPGLAALGPVLPIGTKILLPDLPHPPSQTAKRVVSLFG